MAFKIMPYKGQTYPPDYADHTDINQYYGFKPHQKVPVDFQDLALKRVPLTDGRFTFLVYEPGRTSPTGDWRGKSSRHRVRAQCPDCRAWVPAGRTVQHQCKK